MANIRGGHAAATTTTGGAPARAGTGAVGTGMFSGIGPIGAGRSGAASNQVNEVNSGGTGVGIGGNPTTQSAAANVPVEQGNTAYSQQ